MGDAVSDQPARGDASTSLWESDCKDCQAERSAARRATRGKPARSGSAAFEYSDGWAVRKLERGQSRSDRCEGHRKSHARAIQAIAVPYVDLRVTGEVEDPANPTGPLGGLGRLPFSHLRNTRDVSLAAHDFGMADRDVLRLLEGLKTHRVAVVEAGTGTGKSTFMPFRLANPPAGATLRLTDFGPIVVTEPRRAAATKVARFVGEELCFGCDSRKCDRHIGPGYPVGYQVRGEKRWDGACDLIYVTDGTMINWVRDGRLARIGTVIIDEAHERSENIDVILAQLRVQLRQHEHLRVIITSATLDRDFFIAFFGGAEEVFHLSVPAEKTFGYGVPLFIGLDVGPDIIEKGMALPGPTGIAFEGWPSGGGGPAGEDLATTTKALAALRCGAEIPIEDWPRRMPLMVAEQAAAIAAGTRGGDILAFLPTTDAINRCIDRLKRLVAERRVDIDVFPLLSTTPRDIIDKATAAAGPDVRRKIVVSSNLAETSITLQGVRYVVDSGLICQPEWDPQIASGSYPTKAHSQSGLRQRWGRVGRDAPGWVFPLYTIEQFLSLPRNTPPESAQANLEGFYAKLVAAGLDLDTAVPPGAFVHDEQALDEDARRYVDLFRAETDRARRALRDSGALDGEGDLTSFGRELERFAGPGGSGLALMLAEQLACVHEVALALVVLLEGRLTGPSSECLLAWDRDWPDAWRLRAAQCHRGLAFGCADDLDVLLRVAWLWQTAEDPSAWCRRWWVNESALGEAWKEVLSVVGSLSAAMASEAKRAIDPLLADRVRAVLSRAMVSARYRRVGTDRFAAEHGREGAEEAILRFGLLTEPGDRILAFHRYRRQNVREDEQDPPLISHIVRMVDWAELGGSDPEMLGLELLMKVADSGARDRQPDAEVLSLLEMFPVGLLVTEDAGEDHGPVVAVAAGPFDLPVRVEDRAARRGGVGPPSGFDREWDPERRHRGEVPDEEQALTILKTSGIEENDSSDGGGADVGSVRPYRFEASVRNRVSLAPALASDTLASSTSATIVGYRRNGADFELLCEPASAIANSGDPADQRRFDPWQQIDCRVIGRVSDHERELTILRTLDGTARFLVDPRRAPGLDTYDFEFVDRLAVGGTVSGNVMPTLSGPQEVSLLKWARDHLLGAAVKPLRWGNGSLPFYPGALTEALNAWDNAVVELDHAAPDLGLAHRFQVRGADLRGAGIDPSPGARLLVALGRDRGRRGASLELGTDAAVKVARASGLLEIEGRWARPGKAMLTEQLIRDLVQAGVPPDEAWGFFEESLRLSVFAVLPDVPLEIVELPTRMISLLAMRRRDLEDKWAVRIEVRGWDATVHVSGEDASRVARSAGIIRDWVRSPRLSVSMTPGAKFNRQLAEAQPGVLHIWLDRETQVLSAIGATAADAETGLRYALKPASGIMVVPVAGRRLFFVNEAQALKTLRAMTGCEVDAPRGSDQWFVTGPSAEMLNRLFAYAASVAPGTHGVVTDTGRLRLVADLPRPDPSKRRSKSNG